MIGKITNYNADKGFGFIVGKDNQSYFFHQSKVLNQFELSRNRTVNFTPSTNEKGLCALEVFIVEEDSYSKPTTNQHQAHQKPKQNKYNNAKPKAQKKKFVSVGSISVDIYDVKGVQVHGNCANAKLLVKTKSSGTLVGYYTSDKCSHAHYFHADYMARLDMNSLMGVINEN